MGRKKIYKYNDHEEISFIIIYTSLLVGISLPLIFYNVEFFRFFRVFILIVLSVLFPVFLQDNFSSKMYISLVFFVYLLVAIIIYNASYIENVFLPFLLLGEGVNIY